MKNIVVIGSTGSIGTQALSVIEENKNEFSLLAASCGSNADLLLKQAKLFRPKYVGIFNNSKKIGKIDGCEIVYGNECYKIASLKEADVVLIAAGGIAALPYLLEAVRAGKRIALSNKECMVSCGELILEEAKKFNATIIPVDSEHSAIFQCMLGKNDADVRRVILTASGGAFYDLPMDKWKEVTLKEAVKHPTWSMGRKITVDSQTLVNKGLEIIEAKNLFSLRLDQIDVVIHRESIIHSLVEYIDGSSFANLSYPSMKLPILYSFIHPERIRTNAKELNLAKIGKLTFDDVDEKKFVSIPLAREAAKRGGYYPLCYNTANETLVERFFKGEIRFFEILQKLEKTLSLYKSESGKLSFSNLDNEIVAITELAKRI